MLRRSIASFALLALVAGPSAAQSVDDILAKSFAAQGGVDKLRAVTSVRMSGRMTVAPGVDAPIVIEMKRPKLMRVEIQVQGMTIVQVYDGAQAWMINPMTGRTAPEVMPAEMAKLMDEQADMDGPLMDYKAKGHTVELLGKETVEGAECFKIKLTQKDGAATTFYFDVATFLAVKQESRRTVGGNEVESETIVGDWKSVNGLLFPHSVDSGQKGSPARQKMIVEKVEVNSPIDDARFRMAK